jgi:hypothetical protein
MHRGLRLEALAAEDIEYKALGPNGRETPWVSNAKLCGTRGTGQPLTGFAIRLALHLRDRFDVAHEGAFIEQGVVVPEPEWRALRRQRRRRPARSDPLPAAGARRQLSCAPALDQLEPDQ